MGSGYPPKKMTSFMNSPLSTGDVSPCAVLSQPTNAESQIFDYLGNCAQTTYTIRLVTKMAMIMTIVAIMTLEIVHILHTHTTIIMTFEVLMFLDGIMITQSFYREQFPALMSSQVARPCA